MENNEDATIPKNESEVQEEETTVSTGPLDEPESATSEGNADAKAAAATEEPITIVLIGMAGAGKSTAINRMLTSIDSDRDTSICEEGSTATSVTKHVRSTDGYWLGDPSKKVRLLDTPGLADGNDMDHVRGIAHKLKDTLRTVDQVVLVLNFANDRLTTDIRKMLQAYKEVFDPHGITGFPQYLTVLYSRFDMYLRKIFDEDKAKVVQEIAAVKAEKQSEWTEIIGKEYFGMTDDTLMDQLRDRFVFSDNKYNQGWLKRISETFALPKDLGLTQVYDIAVKCRNEFQPFPLDELNANVFLEQYLQKFRDAVRQYVDSSKQAIQDALALPFKRTGAASATAELTTRLQALIAEKTTDEYFQAQMTAAKCHHIPPDREKWGCVPFEELSNVSLLVLAANEKETLQEVIARAQALCDTHVRRHVGDPDTLHHPEALQSYMDEQYDKVRAGLRDDFFGDDKEQEESYDSRFNHVSAEMDLAVAHNQTQLKDHITAFFADQQTSRAGTALPMLYDPLRKVFEEQIAACKDLLKKYGLDAPVDTSLRLHEKYQQLQTELSRSFAQDIQGGAVTLLQSNLRLRTTQLLEQIKEEFSPSEPPLPTAAFETKLEAGIADALTELNEKYGRCQAWDLVDTEAGSSDKDIDAETSEIVQSCAAPLKEANAEAVAKHRAHLLQTAREALEQQFIPVKSDSTPGYDYVAPDSVAKHTETVKDFASEQIKAAADFLQSDDLDDLVSKLTSAHRERITTYIDCLIVNAHADCKKQDEDRPPTHKTLSTALEAVLTPSREQYPDEDFESHDAKVQSLLSANRKAIHKHLGGCVTVIVESLKLSSASTLNALEKEIEGLAVTAEDLQGAYVDANEDLMENLKSEIETAKEEAKCKLENDIKSELDLGFKEQVRSPFLVEFAPSPERNGKTAELLAADIRKWVGEQRRKFEKKERVTEAPAAASERLQKHIESLFKTLESDMQKVKTEHAAVLASRQRKIIAAMAAVAFVVLDDYLFDLF